MRVASAHRWPYDDSMVEAEYASLGGDRQRIESCHRNAWLVVIEIDGPALEFDAGEVAFEDQPGLAKENWQAAWLEETLLDTEARSSIAFFLHEYTSQGRLFYADQELSLPPLTPLPADLAMKMRYVSP